MLTRQECEQALERLKEHANADNVDDLVTFKKLIMERYYYMPYKREELKKRMWVYDTKYKQCCQIYDVFQFEGRDEWMLSLSTDKGLAVYKGDRFYPVQMANSRNG